MLLGASQLSPIQRGFRSLSQRPWLLLNLISILIFKHCLLHGLVLVDDMILLHLQLLLVHEAELLILYLYRCIAMVEIFKGIRSLILHIVEIEHILLIVGIAAGCQKLIIQKLIVAGLSSVVLLGERAVGRQ